MLLPLVIALHALTAVVTPPLTRILGPRVFLVAALPLGLTAAWVLARTPGILRGHPVEASVPWAPALGIVLDFRVDALSVAMVLLVSGVGAVIFCYAAAYFHRGERALGRLVGVLVLFAAAMFGVVTADNLFALYVFWELTSVSSFLLVAHADQRESARRAATQALVTTAGSGLLMLIGFILLGHLGGTYRISELVADPPPGSPWLSAALVLVLVGAFAKSAQAPLHYWLPAAMVAPTPVSAYLHAAAMVKGGVYLVARLAPGFADTDPWRLLVLVFGAATMILGGWRALRQDDLKLLLAFGTVSQLGMLTVLAGAGTHTAAVAAIGALLAHGLFKATLFLTVGVIDHQAGTRSISRLTGVGRRMPLLAAAAALGAASMAGLPPLLGFVGKEAALEAFVPGAHPGLSATASAAVLACLVLGSVLTFAYSARFLWGAFADKDTVAPVPFPRPGAAFTAAPVLLAAAGLLLGVSAAATVDPVAQSYAAPFPALLHPYHLALWHGPTPALALSALVVAAGALLFWKRRAVTRLQNAMPNWYEAEAGYNAVIQAIRWTAFHVTSRTQTGSLPVYLGIILATVLALPGVRLAAALLGGDVAVPAEGDGLRLWDSPLEVVVVLIVTVTAVATVREHRRFPALILISALGFGIAGLFVLHGAPDLALTLVLVETLTTIILVFVLRRLPATFTTRPNGWPKRLTVLMCAAAGTFLALTLWLASHARTHPPVSLGYTGRAAEAGGDNLVNVIIADFRALDTLGEVVVLVTAAVAVASLVLLNRRDRIIRAPEADDWEETAQADSAASDRPGPQPAAPDPLAAPGANHAHRHGPKED
ncbi:hydrogen gas-evolving membrane-bound hydrogenase subunit E [Thermobifida cellulosilytica]|uniref:hydrogen gas-evolving membrane-bound hydrogenase subunit E n=1 Tax=Thermobifida cellulosilytica TaxID=144786 RepID=UPI000A01022C|nr:hydrogen gas-evolving membrane-bound hydrogenase subunit E [Thermobifida cellulosilytica]